MDFKLIVQIRLVQSCSAPVQMHTLEWTQIPIALHVDTWELQNWVTLAIRKAEYVSTVEAGKEIVWIRNLLLNLVTSLVLPSPSIWTTLQLLLPKPGETHLGDAHRSAVVLAQGEGERGY